MTRTLARNTLLLALTFQAAACRDTPAGAPSASAAEATPAGVDSAEPAASGPAAPVGQQDGFSITIRHPKSFFDALDRASGQPSGGSAKAMLGSNAQVVSLDSDQDVVLDSKGGWADLRLEKRTAAATPPGDPLPSLTIEFDGPRAVATLPIVFDTMMEALEDRLADSDTKNAVINGMSVSEWISVMEKGVREGTVGVERFALAIVPVREDETKITADITIEEGQFPLTPALQYLRSISADVAPIGDAVRYCPDSPTFVLGVMPRPNSGPTTFQLLSAVLKGLGVTDFDPKAQAMFATIKGPAIVCQAPGDAGLETWEVVSFTDDAKAASAAFAALRAQNGESGAVRFKLETTTDAFTLHMEQEGRTNAMAARIIDGRLVTAVGSPAVIDKMKKAHEPRQNPTSRRPPGGAPFSANVDFGALVNRPGPPSTLLVAAKAPTERGIRIELTADTAATKLLVDMLSK
ncbi:MAG: hypothetical protein HOW73_33775 [Polyangiaceae bacterium]|nr:hypothetical protein [Polyangiaceae bacterium]